MSIQTRSCRLCDENNDQMYNIFEKNVFDIQIINMIKDCLPILIYRSDPLSKYICHSCNENLNMFCEFKKSCLEIANKHRDDLQMKADNDPKIMLYLKQLVEDNFEEPVSTPTSMEIINEEASSDTVVDDSKSEDRASIAPQISDATSNNVNNNDDSGGSDMEIDDTVPNTSSIEETATYNNECGDAIVEKPRISGPKSMTNTYTKLIETDEIVYQPLSLEEIVVRCINTLNISEYKMENWKEQIRTVDKLNYCCRYCEEMFEQESKLALHELENHIRLSLLKVDKGLLWSRKQEDYKIRNKWKQLQTQIDRKEMLNNSKPKAPHVEVEVEKAEENELLVPQENVEPEVIQLQPVLDVSRNSIVYFVGEEPYANGMPLRHIPKETRNTFYQGVLMHGIKRKFCQLCRHTFKDNWSIDVHYISMTCYFTCNYCGQKFKRCRSEFAPHLAKHVELGHEKSSAVFQPNDKGEIREFDTSCLELHIPSYNNNSAFKKQASAITPSPKPAPTPKPASTPKPPPPSQMTLRVRVVTPKQEPMDHYEYPVMMATPARTKDTREKSKETEKETKATKFLTVDDLAKNQAYFCKKCYQVFTKLDSYNTHIKTCNGEIDDPEMSLIRHYNKKDGSSPVFCTKVKPPQNYRRSPGGKSRPAVPGLKPLGNHLLSQSIKIKQELRPEQFNQQGPSEAGDLLPCHLCDAVFKSKYSRNSHMRIHVKPKAVLNSSVQVTKTASSSSGGGVKRATDSPLPASKRVKTDNFEPIVEIHEGGSKTSTSIRSSVSITPFKRSANGGGSINVRPDIMKLVQNNPHITLKPRQHVAKQAEPREMRTSSNHDSFDSSQSGDEVDPQKGYKCASCSQWFGNKSTLYFHKKNTCNGSRYPCPFCKKRFGTANEYSSHIFYAHPE